MSVAVGSAITGSPVITGCEMLYWVADEAARGLADPNSSINITSRVCHAAAALSGTPIALSAGSAALVVGSASMATEYITGGWISLYPLANRLKLMAIDRLGRHLYGIICPVEANHQIQEPGYSCRTLTVVKASQDNGLFGKTCQYITANAVNQWRKMWGN